MTAQTARLLLREVTLRDAAFMRRLMNDPGFIENIGDREIYSDERCVQYLQNNMLSSYQQHGYGAYIVEELSTNLPVGICGLFRREGLPVADVGFAFLKAACGKGYATESAFAVLEHARTNLKMDRVLGVTSPGNHASAKVLQKIGLKSEGLIRLTPESPESRLFSISWPSS